MRVTRDVRPFVGAANGEAFILRESHTGVEVVSLKTSMPVFKAYGLTSNRSKILYTPFRKGNPSGELYLEDLSNGHARKITSHLVLDADLSPVNDSMIAYSYAGGETFGLAIANLDFGREELLVTKDVFPGVVRWSVSGTGLHYYASTTEEIDLASFPGSGDAFEAYVHWNAENQHSMEHVPTLKLIKKYVQVTQGSDEGPDSVPFAFPLLEKPSVLESLRSKQPGGGEKAFNFRAAASDHRHEVLGDKVLGLSSLFAQDSESGSVMFLGRGQLIETLRTGAVIKEFAPKGSTLKFVDWKGNSTTLAFTAVNYNLPVKTSVMIQGGSGYSAPGSCNLTAHSGAMEYAYDFQNVTVGAHALASADGLVILAISSASCNSVDTDGCSDYSSSCGGAYFGNVVIIQHADGTYSKYTHLETDSPQVAVGTMVDQGLYIGRQGHTGSTSGTFNGCGDHVHFQLQSSPDVFGQSVPVDFADVASEPLACGVSYTSASNEISHSISPSSQNFDVGGGVGIVNVTSTGGTWYAISKDAWITITSAASGSGSGTVVYSVSANAAGPRTGTLNVGGHIVTVSQNGTQPQNQGPSVNAGNDQTTTLPAAINLNGTASDDGYPNPPATLTTTWSKVSGPGSVTFGNANTPNTTASFSLAGVYVLRITANDGEFSASDDVTVIANINNGGGVLSGSQANPPSTTNLSSQGTTDWAHWGLSSSTSFNHKSGVSGQLNDFVQIGSTTPVRYTNNSVSYSWSDGIPFPTASNTTTGIYTYGIGNGFQITVPADTTQKTLKLYVGLWNSSGRVEVSLSDGSASPYIDNSMSSSGVQNGVYTLNFKAATNGQTLTVRWVVENSSNPAGNITLQAATLAVPVNQAPIANAGTDQVLTLPATASLVGSVTDDGLPNPPAAVTSTWSKVSGPGSVTFGSINSLTSTANFSSAGSYVLRLTVNDGALTATDDISITVSNIGGPGLLTASGAAPPGNTNLATQGTNDWAHWGLSSSSSFNRKNGVSQQISNFTPIGNGTVQRYANNPTTYTWTGGTPNTSATNTPTGLFVMGANNGFQLTVPADTTQRTLKVYLGLWAAGGRFEASLSDGSAVPYIDTSLLNSSGTTNHVYTLNYRAGSAGQSLTIRWTVSTTFNQWSNVTLQAATLVGGAPPTNQPPSVNAGADQTLTLPNAASLSGTTSDDGLPNPPAAVTVTWSKVSGPGTVTFGNTNSLNTTATFSMSGTYVLRLTGNDGLLSGSDDVSITANQVSAGSLSGTVASTPSNVNLSTDGISDWTHWGLSGASSLNRKSGVPQKISNYVRIGTGTIQQYSNNPNFYTWTGGTPTASSTNTPTGIYVIGMSNGFQITVPADTTQRTLKMYVGLWAAGGTFQASLSDGSAAAFTDASMVNPSGTTNGVYTLNYKAGSSGQTLTVRWTVNTIFNQWSNVTLQAATLVDSPPAANQMFSANGIMRPVSRRAPNFRSLLIPPAFSSAHWSPWTRWGIPSS
ncbi:MAG: peptidoglycan DD-metalloendopeptidase family protein [Pyrinomonadaceae bacterium]